MSFLWVVVWLLYRFINGHPAQLHILNVWLLALLIAAVIDLSHWRRYVVRYRR